jgi:excisionase family DNA binding protein
MSAHSGENLTPQEAAALLGVSYGTIKQWIYQHKIKSFTTPGGHHRIPFSEVERIKHAKESQIEFQAPVEFEGLSPNEKAKYKLLLVEDISDSQGFIGHYLTEEGYGVEVAGNGVEALQALSRRMPDLILTDIAMPEMDGLELIKRVRSNPELKGIPILVISAFVDEKTIIGKEFRKQAIGVGANDVLPKPFDASELDKRVRSLLDI